MSKMVSVMVSLLEEQAALLHRHIGHLRQLAADGGFETAAAEPETSHKKKVKAPKDPNRPKRPLSGYQLFMADNNAKFKEENPEASATDIMSLVARAWSVVDPKKKEGYLTKANALKEQYAADVSEYVANKADHDGHDVEAAKATKKKEPKAPKATSSSSSAPAPKPAAPVVPAVAAPIVAPPTPNTSSKKHEEKSSKKHKRSESVGSEENVIFAAATEADESAKKKKVINMRA